jgi:hypothetical protein
VAIKLISNSDVKAFLRIQKIDASAVTTWDTVLDTLIEQVSKRFETFTRRRFYDDGATQVDEYFDSDGDTQLLSLRQFPIVSGTVDLFEDYDSTFAAATELDESEYRVHLEDGQVEMVWRSFFWGKRTIKVSYRGGWTATAGIIDAPDDLKHAALLQVSHLFQRRDQLGGLSQSFGEGQTSYEGAYKLLPEVRSILMSHRAVIL